MTLNLNKAFAALRDWVGIVITLASGIAVITGQLATIPAPLGVKPSEWAYIGVIAAGAQLVVVALTKFSTIFGAATVQKAQIESESRERIAALTKEA